ncbi:MAG: hypothetical protein J7L41_01290 [Synergistetes bacterium]|nr:hypothetical protein [Synergistota bacterium]
MAFVRELENVDPKLRHTLLLLIEEVERQREESVSKKEFNELKEIVRELGENVKELSEAQKRTEERLESLAEKLESLTARVEELSEAQKRTEERLESLAARVEELSEAQKRTEQEIQKLTKRMETFEERLEGISNSVGYSLENSAYRALPSLLLQRHGIEVEDGLVRRYVTVKNKDIHVNVYRYAQKDGRRILILGECKVRPSKKEIERFERYARLIGENESVDVFLLFVAHDYPPSIERFLQAKGIAYFWSYEL